MKKKAGVRGWFLGRRVRLGARTVSRVLSFTVLFGGTERSEYRLRV